MPVTVSYPGLYIEELPSSAHTITPAPTSITVFVGYVHPFQGECARDGNWAKPIRIFNSTDYERHFGTKYRNQSIGRSEVGYAVEQFFLNGGSDAYVVGLRPKYYGDAGAEADVEPATNTELSGIKLTAKEVTDADDRIAITIRNVRASTSGGANDTADVLVTYKSRSEAYRGVKIGDPTTLAADKDFIGKRLADSGLVAIEPNPTYPTAFSITGSQQTVYLEGMPAPSAFTPTGLFRAQTFVDVFADEGLLDKVEIFNLLVVPGIADASVWNRGLAFCEGKRAMFIMDPPENASADGLGGIEMITTIVEDNRIPMVSPNGALYFPYLKTLDPQTGDTVRLPPSGYVAGVYARTDTNRGVWKAPAGLETSLINTTGVVEEGRMTDMRQGLLNPIGVNVLRSFPGSGTVIWGARTIVTNNKAFEQWRYVPVRRMALFIEQTLLRNLGWVVFEPNDEPLWSAIRLSIEGFMLALFHQQAFQGRTPTEAFLVKCDKTTTTQEDINLGKVNIVVGFRPLKPAEFVIIKITQLAGQVQA
jgi:phage tail sheath protein FI